jgi:hypothetical protein
LFAFSINCDIIGKDKTPTNHKEDKMHSGLLITDPHYGAKARTVYHNDHAYVEVSVGRDYNHFLRCTVLVKKEQVERYVGRVIHWHYFFVRKDGYVYPRRWLGLRRYLAGDVLNREVMRAKNVADRYAENLVDFFESSNSLSEEIEDGKRELECFQEVECLLKQ